MSAPTRSLAEIAQRGQESVAAVVRLWADMAQTSVKVITSGPSELLVGRKAVGYFFDVANQVLDGQRALLGALTSARNGAGVAASSASKAVADVRAAEIRVVAEVAKTESSAAAEIAKTESSAVAEVAKAPAVVDTAKVAETPKVAETLEAAETPKAEAPKTEAPKTEAPKTEAPKADAAKTPKAAKAPESTKTPKTAKAPEGPYGKGSHAPLVDRSQTPAGFPIKGNDGSKLYHVPGSPFYRRTTAEVWFATPQAAEAAGFRLPASQR